MTRSTEDRRKYMQEYYAQRREAKRAYQRQWRIENPEKVKAYTQTPEAKESVRLAAKAYRERNPAKVQEWGKDAQKRRLTRNREFYNGIKAGMKCLNPECKWVGDYDPCTLDFHHVDQSDKTECVSQMLSTKTALLREMSKCTVLCAVCHRLVTWGKLEGSGLPKINVEGLVST